MLQVSEKHSTMLSIGLDCVVLVSLIASELVSHSCLLIGFHEPNPISKNRKLYLRRSNHLETKMGSWSSPCL